MRCQSVQVLALLALPATPLQRSPRLLRRSTPLRSIAEPPSDAQPAVEDPIERPEELEATAASFEATAAPPQGRRAPSETFRAGFVGIVGSPNVGKSALRAAMMLAATPRPRRGSSARGRSPGPALGSHCCCERRRDPPRPAGPPSPTPSSARTSASQRPKPRPRGTASSASSRATSTSSCFRTRPASSRSPPTSSRTR